MKRISHDLRWFLYNSPRTTRSISTILDRIIANYSRVKWSQICFKKGYDPPKMVIIWKRKLKKSGGFKYILRKKKVLINAHIYRKASIINSVRSSLFKLRPLDQKWNQRVEGRDFQHKYVHVVALGRFFMYSKNRFRYLAGFLQKPNLWNTLGIIFYL